MKHLLAKAVVCIAMITTVVLVTACQSAPAAPSPTVDVNHPYDVNANGQRDIDAALTLAKSDKKNVLLDFGGNWCPDCLVLAKFYETEPLKTLVDKNYHIVAIDIGNFDKQVDISDHYGSPIKNGVPAVVVLDPTGKMVGSTADGALESARAMTVQQVFDILKKWTPTAN